MNPKQFVKIFRKAAVQVLGIPKSQVKVEWRLVRDGEMRVTLWVNGEDITDDDDVRLKIQKLMNSWVSN